MGFTVAVVEKLFSTFFFISVSPRPKLNLSLFLVEKAILDLFLISFSPRPKLNFFDFYKSLLKVLK